MADRATTKEGIAGVIFEHEGQRGTCTEDFKNNWMVDLACQTRLERLARDNGNEDALALLTVVKRMLDI
jgi:hypothetical protein